MSSHERSSLHSASAWLLAALGVVLLAQSQPALHVTVELAVSDGAVTCAVTVSTPHGR
jgi:hypothetical protein